MPPTMDNLDTFLREKAGDLAAQAADVLCTTHPGISEADLRYAKARLFTAIHKQLVELIQHIETPHPRGWDRVA